jgi:voltage-gated potassium channel
MFRCFLVAPSEALIPPTPMLPMLNPLRQAVAFYLEDVETPIGKTITIVVTGLILLSCGLFVLETYPLNPTWHRWLHWIDDGLLVLFGVEYLLRLWSAPDRWRFFWQVSSLIDLLVLLPLVLGITGWGIANLGFLRIFRWLRILRLVRFIEGNSQFGYVSSADGAIVVRILFTLFAIIFVYSGLIYQVEHPINSGEFNTFLDAVYFAVSSISTAGFGDITPISQTGRLLAVLMILTGLVLIPWQLGDLIKRLVKSESGPSDPRNSPEQVHKLCSGCGRLPHDADAQFCKVCGKALPANLTTKI